jgi:hypothetical protein
MAVLTSAEVLPSTLMLLPAAQGGLTTSLGVYAQHMRDWGLDIPAAGPIFGGIFVTSVLAAAARLLEHAVTYEEYEVVSNAIQNADRYYKVMAVDSSSNSPQTPDSAAQAFKAVAFTWLVNRQQACTILALLTAFEVAFQGFLWRLTGDMAAPIAAALMMTAVDLSFVKQLLRQQSRQSRMR